MKFFLEMELLFYPFMGSVWRRWTQGERQATPASAGAALKYGGRVQKSARQIADGTHNPLFQGRGAWKANPRRRR